MARNLFNAELGFGVHEENGDLLVALISGTAAPDGVSGQQGIVPIGSLYARSGTGELYQKIANAGAPADWELNGNSSVQLGAWRPERVDAHTGQVLSAGVTDPTGWSDNDGGADGNDFTVGNFVLDGNCNLFEVTVVTSATSITLAAASTPPAADELFSVKYNLVDPAGQEGQAIILFDGSACIKIADVDFANASGILLDAGYTPASGDPTGGENLLQTIQKLDGNNDAQDQALGISQGDTDMGAYTGNIITDNTSQVAINQELSDAIEENQQPVFEGTIAQSTPTVVDSFNVDEFQMGSYLLTTRDSANPDRVRTYHIDIAHDGHGAADATDSDNNVFARLNLGNVNTQISTTLTGSGASQVLNLVIDTNEASGINYTLKRMDLLPLAG